MRAESTIKRRKSRQVMVGAVPVGGDAPIAVQSMTNTNTLDVDATVAQIQRLEAVGADIVRVSVPSIEAAEALVKSENGSRSHWSLIFTLTTELHSALPN